MNKKKPLVSIIVPVYNVESYLERCIESVIGQTYKNIEILIIDDGSSDRSGAIADKYAKKDKRITVIHKKNGGLSSARNKGIAESSGEYLLFVDSDDYIKSNYCEKLLSLAIDNNAEMATCNFQPFSLDGSHLKTVRQWPEGVLSGESAVLDMYIKKSPAYIVLNIFKKSLFIKNGLLFPEGHEYEDISTKIKALYLTDKVAFTNERLYYYLIRNDSITGKEFSRTKYDDYDYAIKDIDSFTSRLRKNKYEKEFSYFQLGLKVNLLNHIAKSKRRNLDSDKYWRVIRKDIRALYKKAAFPSAKARIIYKIVIILSASRAVYSALYRRAKK